MNAFEESLSAFSPVYEYIFVASDCNINLLLDEKPQRDFLALLTVSNSEEP